MLVTAAVLASALLHACWNALAHRVPEPMAAMALIGLGQTVICVPLLFVVTPPSAAARPWLACSLVLHVVYVALLARSYRLGDFGQVYPIARGTSPLVVTVVAALFLDERLSAPVLTGVLVVCCGLVLLAGGSGSRAAIVAAVLTGLSISAYTVVDGVGTRADGGRLGYTVWLLSGVSLGMVGCAALTFRRRLPSVLAGRWWLVPIGGVLGWCSYALALWAQARGALGAIAALRETSVIVAAVIGTVFFGERFGRRRIAATVLVATGIVLINIPSS